MAHPNTWHALHSPLGIKNSINFYPRGYGYIIVDRKNIRNTMILQAAAYAAGHPAGVLVIDQENPHGGKSVNMPYFDGDKIVNMSLQIQAIETVKHFVSRPEAKWVAFANHQAATPELLAAAAKTWPGQNFVRSIMTFTDPSAEMEKLAAMLLEPRTVCDNLSRHGFVAPDESNQILPGSGENDLGGGEDISETSPAADGSSAANVMRQSANPELSVLGTAVLGPVAGVGALVGMNALPL
ncbi:MAG: hypothetical protein ACD_73C00387G0003 [uncultured bacterium]|nr:MAG: hypothetical protein ACD_73C00387G0003 [uncultured bacterium]